MKIRQLFMLLVPAVLLAGCSAESQWKSAASQDTIAAYQNYLSGHPTGNRDRHRWTEGSQSGSISGDRLSTIESLCCT
jgi:hypothetical protein